MSADVGQDIPATGGAKPVADAGRTAPRRHMGHLKTVADSQSARLRPVHLPLIAQRRSAGAVHRFRPRVAAAPSKLRAAWRRLVKALHATALLGGWLTSAVLAADSPKAPPAPVPDVLELQDGSTLRGRLLELDRERGLRWQHPQASAPLAFRPGIVARLQYGQPQSLLGRLPATSQFRLRNGDEFAGELRGLDAETVTLDTWFGKNFKLPRAAVSRIGLVQAHVLYEGPTGIEGWTPGHGSPAWEFRDGRFVAERASFMGRSFPELGSITLEFDLTWTGPFTLMVPLYTDVINRLDFMRSAYTVHLHPGAVAIQRTDAGPLGVSIAMLGEQQPIPAMTRASRVRLEIRMHKEEAVFEVLADGELVGRWRDERGFVAKGTGIALYAQVNGTTVTLSNLRLTSWEGGLPAGEPVEPSETDRLSLANGDEVTGRLLRLEADKLWFAAPGGELQIPPGRITQIVFASPCGPVKSNTPAGPGQARVELAGGGALNLHVERADQQVLVGRSEHFGPVQFPASGVRQVVWSPQPRASAAGRVRLRNGDHLAGTLQSLHMLMPLRWMHPDAESPIEFQAAALAELQFVPTMHFPVATGAHTATLRLVNGDELQGVIQQLTAQQVTITSPIAGRLVIPRAVIEMIVPLTARGAPRYVGPTGLEGWTLGKITTVPNPGEWQYADGAFSATRPAAIGRDLNLPEVASIRFDLSWKGALQEAIALYCDSLQPVNLARKEEEPKFGGFYSLQLNSVSAMVMAVKQKEPLRTLEPVLLPRLGQKSRARFDIRVNKPERTLALLVDGDLIKQWTDAEFIASGTGIRFVHQGLGEVRLSNLVVNEWDGQFEEPVSPPTERAQDLVKLRNGDRVSGLWETLEPDRLVVSTAGGKIEVPLSRVRQIELAARPWPQAPGAVNARLELADHQLLQLRLERWDGDSLTGTHPLLGRMKISARAIERVELGEPLRESAAIAN